ncbi:hypothetical protein PSHT_05618 [Puccinia striiformis]|uniref:Uncharacterized protein n=1 Tax=Puccinia striiformis TaxID=27350 RepID=A0A2S4W9Z9_9BASI|nr:hypothetical protein PSHT_05618 [Puccinia striiformis]
MAEAISDQASFIRPRPWHQGEKETDQVVNGFKDLITKLEPQTINVPLSAERTIQGALSQLTAEEPDPQERLLDQLASNTSLERPAQHSCEIVKPVKLDPSSQIHAQAPNLDILCQI